MKIFARDFNNLYYVFITHFRIFLSVTIVHVFSFTRATSALRLTFQIPKDVRDYIDILPKTAYIQAESEFSAQLKLLPRSSLVTDELTSCYDKTNGLLDARILIRVADQVGFDSLHYFLT